MVATVFLAICILGCDVLLYFLFQWTYGETRRGLARRSNSRRPAASKTSQPIEFVPARRKSLASNKSPQAIAFRSQRLETRGQDRRTEHEAYQRIAATFAAARR